MISSVQNVSNLSMTRALLPMLPADAASTGAGVFNFAGFPRSLMQQDGTLVDQTKAGLTNANVKGVELVYEWSELEPYENQTRFDKIAQDAQDWVNQGKNVVLRFMTAGNRASSSPEWVYDDKGVRRVRTLEFGSPFLSNFTGFEAALSEERAAMMREVEAFRLRSAAFAAVVGIHAGRVCSSVELVAGVGDDGPGSSIEHAQRSPAART